MSPPGLIPRPLRLWEEEGHFRLDRPITISSEMGSSPAGRLRSWLRERNVSTEFGSSSSNAQVVIEQSEPSPHARDSYQLWITPERIRISSAAESGTFYALQTLHQLLPLTPTDGASLPCMVIEDEPRFPWRGLHLDVARHFFPSEYVMRVLDWMAMHKLNRFHWHLTEDQGWRIEIPSYPKLTEIGAWRRGNSGERYGGFYTLDEIARVVAYAKSLHIEVVPEIEMPGHAQAALAAYPHLSCTGGPFEVWTEWGISDEVYCAGNEDVFAFLRSVLETVLDVFPGDYVHLGADECPKRRWKSCPQCQARMKSERLADEAELQSYFMKRMVGFLASRGRKAIGWDEILEGGVPAGTVVMSWRGTDGGVAAARAGHDVIMTPNSHVYFDYKHSEDDALGRLGVTPLEKVYGFEPVPASIGPDKVRRVLGSQANVWTEGIETEADFEHLVFPRLCALAEVVWSGPERDWADFRRRLRDHGARLDAAGIRYYKDPTVWSPDR